jgi:glycosyltransferase involved in cell wall biosynthesis
MVKIHQILPTIVFGDAVSNDALAITNILKEMGYDTQVFSEHIHPSLTRIARKAGKWNPTRDTILVYHMSTGSQLSYMVKDADVRAKVMIYHNITPPEFFRGYSRSSYDLVQTGRDQLAMLKDTFDYVFADSEYNCMELQELGYKKAEELPILIPYADYEKNPSEEVMNHLADGRTNILFLGRIAPNKRQEDVIKSFYYYKKYFDSSSRLFLVGSYDGMELYYKGLKRLVEKLELQDVYFTGKVPFDEILAYYRTAHVFLSMSEHEGFCVPLIESMIFDVPIIAYKAAAIPYTMKNAGIMIGEKNYPQIAALLDKAVHDEQLRDSVIKQQKSRLADFSYDRVSGMHRQAFRRIISEIS